MKNIFSKIEMLKEILHDVESLVNDLKDSDAASAEAASDRYLQLVDKFYEHQQDMLAEQQYEAAKDDFKYFLRLLKLAIAYWEEEAEKETRTP